MDRCSDLRPLADLDPVTFFIVTELMAAREQRQEVHSIPNPLSEASEDLFRQVA